MDRAFLIVLSRVIGLRFFGGPFSLPGFCKAINSPDLILRDSCSSKALFKTFAMLPCTLFASIKMYSSSDSEKRHKQGV